MLLAIDVGNTNTTLGVFDGQRLVAHWRVQTRAERTSDEYTVLLSELFAFRHVEHEAIHHACLSCVVPPVQNPVVEALVEYLDLNPLVISPGVRTGMPLLLDNPKEAGADRIANAVAAYETAKKSCIVVDFGTATTFDMVSDQGEYLGGAIAPGIQLSADALFAAAAKLPRVSLLRPRHAIGRNTEESLQAGLVFGYVGLVDGVVERMMREREAPDCRVFATGGQARLLVGASRFVRDVDEFLTLRGLRILYRRNRA